MSPSLFELWRTSLRLRPLLWIALCIVGGGVLGLQLASSWEPNPPFYRTPYLLALVFLAFGFLALSLSWRGRASLAARTAFGAACICAMCAGAAWRILPSPNDISQLIPSNATRQAPLRAPLLTLRGYVADYPQRGEFSMQFPLHCIEYDSSEQQRLSTNSFVWVTAPPDLPIEVGDAIQVQGELRPLARATNPGQREEHWRFVLKRCWSRLRVKKPALLTPLGTSPHYIFKRKVAAGRLAILQHYEYAFKQRGNPYPHANAQLLTAMVFGEGGLSAPLPALVRDEFRIAGLSHVLVASGSQIALCCALLLGLGKITGVRGGWLLALVLPLLFLYATIAGGAPSIIRAAIAGILVTVAVLSGRDIDALSLWSAALIGLVAVDPAQLMSLSLQLSFAATWGLIVLTPLLQKPMHSLFGKNFMTELAAFSMSAQMGVLPILLYHFGKISLAGLGANMLGVPLAGFLVATGIGGLLLPLAGINEFLTRGIAGVASFFAALPGAQVEQSPLRLAWALAYYAILLTVVGVWGITSQVSMQSSRHAKNHPLQDHWLIPLTAELGYWRRRVRWPRLPEMLALLFLAVFILAGFGHYQARPQPFRMAMLDVGQGESLVLISPEQRVALVDGGGDVSGWRTDVGRSVIVPYLQARGVRKIDILVITHADADHCNGLKSVLREVPVGQVLDGVLKHDPAAVEYEELKREILQRHIPLMKARAGQRLDLGSATLHVLAPLLPALPGDNDNSVVLRMDYEHTSLLLTGDIEQDAEERLARRGVNLQCTVLKAAHHGSRTSSSPLFLRAARPQAALISCGRYNQFGHPSAAVLRRLDEIKVPVFRTDLDGEIEVLSDGQKCWIETAR